MAASADGIARDPPAGEASSVLRGDCYAVAAPAGAAVIVVGRMPRLPVAYGSE